MVRLWWLLALTLGSAACLQGQTPPEKAPSAASCAEGKARDARCAEKGGGQARPGAAKGVDGAETGDSKGDPFAFPEERSRHGADAAGGAAGEMPSGPVPDPPASSERPVGGGASEAGSSSSGSSSSSATAEDDTDVAPTVADPRSKVKAAPLKDLGGKVDSSEARKKLELTRLDDDVRVGNFYLRDGNAQGAYLRFKDAVERDAGDPDAQFGLAEAARRLRKTDEAKAHYAECLRLEPDGDHAKPARKALEQMGVQAKR